MDEFSLVFVGSYSQHFQIVAGLIFKVFDGDKVVKREARDIKREGSWEKHERRCLGGVGEGIVLEAILKT